MMQLLGMVILRCRGPSFVFVPCLCPCRSVLVSGDVKQYVVARVGGHSLFLFETVDG